MGGVPELLTSTQLNQTIFRMFQNMERIVDALQEKMGDLLAQSALGELKAIPQYLSSSEEECWNVHPSRQLYIYFHLQRSMLLYLIKDVKPIQLDTLLQCDTSLQHTTYKYTAASRLHAVLKDEVGLPSDESSVCIRVWCGWSLAGSSGHTYEWSFRYSPGGTCET